MKKSDVIIEVLDARDPMVLPAFCFYSSGLPCYQRGKKDPREGSQQDDYSCIE